MSERDLREAVDGPRYVGCNICGKFKALAIPSQYPLPQIEFCTPACSGYKLGPHPQNPSTGEPVNTVMVDAQDVRDLLYRLDTALNIASDVCGAHHKQWVIDQMARTLTGDRYSEWIADRGWGEDGPDTYGWDEGIAP